MSEQNHLERRFEKFLFASRWLMAPMYLGLVVALGMLLVVFTKEIFYYLPQVMEMKGEDVILVALTLIDLTLAANLLLIVLFLGLRELRLEVRLRCGRGPAGWMGTVDFGGLKMKLIASIVAISAIDLLEMVHGDRGIR